MKSIITCSTIAAVAIISAAAVNNSGAQYQNRARQAQQPVGVTAPRQASAGAGARPVATGASLMGLQKALTAFGMDVGRMPTAAEGLNALLYPPPGAKNWRGPYISSNNFRAALTDPWGSQYRYVVQGAGRQAVHYIISNGPDRLPGTRDDLSVQF